jgi:transcriptional regulator with XRE-family HTH domain
LPSTVHQAKEAFGQRLRDIRKDAGLTGRQLAMLAGWHSSKVSKIEYGKQTPSEDDLRVWCQHCAIPEQFDDLVATVRDIEAMYVEWRRRLRTGTRRRQQKSLALEAEAGLLRWYEPLLIPGILHTAEYATEIMSRIIDFYEIPNDLEAGVAARMERQQILYSGKQRFHFILAQQALRTMVGNAQVMVGQLDRLLTVLSLARVSLGILPTRATYRVPTNQFIMFDDRVVHVETVSAELAVTQPREVLLYVRAFQSLSEDAIYGRRAGDMISAAMTEIRGAPR